MRARARRAATNVLARTVDIGDPRAGPREAALLPVERDPAAGGQLSCGALGPDPSSAGVSRAGGRLGRDRLLRPLEQARDPPGGQEVDGARLELRAVDLGPERARVVCLGDDGRLGGGPRMEPERDARDQPEPAARAGEELPEVVPGDVLDHLAARARDHPARKDDGDADHEVAHRAVAMAPRAREVGGEARADGRVARRVEREHLPVLAEVGLQVGQPDPRLDDRGEVARLVLEHPGQPCGRELDLAARALDRDARPGGEDGRGLLEGRRLRDARQARPAPAGAHGRGREPRRRAVASGRSCPGSRSRRDRSPTGEASSPRDRAR